MADKIRVLLSEEEVDKRIKEIADQINKDYEGKDMVVINYDFTNNSEDTMSALVGIYMQAFQDGVQLDTAMVLDDSVYDAGIAQKDIKPGTTLEGCQNAFVLTSDSPVEIEVSDMFNDPTVGMTYDVQN